MDLSLESESSGLRDDPRRDVALKWRGLSSLDSKTVRDRMSRADERERDENGRLKTAKRLRLNG